MDMEEKRSPRLAMKAATISSLQESVRWSIEKLSETMLEADFGHMHEADAAAFKTHVADALECLRKAREHVK